MTMLRWLAGLYAVTVLLLAASCGAYNDSGPAMFAGIGLGLIPPVIALGCYWLDENEKQAREATRRNRGY
jgi:hypothetical protein